MKVVVSCLLLVVGVIHLLPVTGVLGGPRLATLYGLGLEGPDLEILMRHRAVLFGLLGLFLICAAIRPALQPAAFIAGIASVSSFLWLAWSVGGYNAQIGRVVAADIVALVCLVVAVGAWFWAR